MKKRFSVIKKLELEFICEAETEEDAERLCIETDEEGMALVDCQYEVSQLAHPDAGLQPFQLQAKYPDEHPDFPKTAWANYVTDNHVLPPSYWDWVITQLKATIS